MSSKKEDNPKIYSVFQVRCNDEQTQLIETVLHNKLTFEEADAIVKKNDAPMYFKNMKDGDYLVTNNKFTIEWDNIKHILTAEYVKANSFSIYKPILVFKENLYEFKAYFHDCNWVDKDGVKITEKLISFQLEHAGNSINIHLNVKESELGEGFCNAIAEGKKLIEKHRAERKVRLLTERAERKLFPKRIDIAFRNVVLTSIEEFEYIGKKKVKIYANGRPYRYGDYEVETNFEVTEEFILKCALSHYLASTYQNEPIIPMPVEKDKTKGAFMPFHFYIGYGVEFKGMQLLVKDFSGGGCLGKMNFDTQMGKIELEVSDYNKIEIVGEIKGADKLTCLINKLKFME